MRSLPVGVIAGVVILIMCVTGVLLAYEKQIILWADTSSYRSAAPTADARHLPIETLIENARNHRGTTPASLTLRSDPSHPAEVGFGRETLPLFLNPYSGQVLGEGLPLRVPGPVQQRGPHPVQQPLGAERTGREQAHQESRRRRAA